MNKCFSCCCGGGDETDDERSGDERSRLVNGTSRGGSSRGRDYGSHTNATASQNANANVQNGDDEQAILSRILQQTANDVIDVAAVDAHGVEPQEYVNRARNYNQKLSSMQAAGNASISASSTKKPNKSILIENSSQQVEKCLSAPPMSFQEASVLKQNCQEIGRAVGDIRVEHREDLVVQFAPN